MMEVLKRIKDGLVYAPVFLLRKSARILPFRTRIDLAAWGCRWAVALLPGAQRRLAENFDIALPDLPMAERKRIGRDMARGFGRTMSEIFFAEEHQDNLMDLRATGPGLDVLIRAHEAGTGAVLVGGHYGQWDAMRFVLKPLGIQVAALYRPTNNRFYSPHHERGLAVAGEPMFPKGSPGVRGMVRHLRSGGFLAILADQHLELGTPLPFLGTPARTTLSPAELALKYDVPLVPFFPVRRDAEGRIDVEFAAAIPPSTPTEMMQQFNDLISDRIRAHPEQWLWLHRRWKDER